VLPRLLEALLALVSFAAGAWLFRSVVPHAEGGRLHAKLEYFAEHKDEFDAVYLGASRVFRGLDPVLVDEELARGGLDVRSFNFGASAMWTFEQDYLLHHVLAMRPRRLRWIFYGGRPVGLSVPGHHALQEDPNLFGARGVQWHTPGETLAVLESIRCAPLSLRRKLELALTHLELLARNLTNLGRGGAVLARLLERPPERAARARLLELVHARQGYFGLEEASGRPHAEAMGELLRDPTPYLAAVERIDRQNALPVELDEINLGVYRRQFRKAGEHGIELIHFTTPGYEGSPERIRLHELGIVPTLFHFNDPRRWPELFRIEERYDLGHLNDAGARRFSRLFAAAILEHVQAARGE
jgi:hypothetical protein